MKANKNLKMPACKTRIPILRVEASPNLYYHPSKRSGNHGNYTKRTLSYKIKHHNKFPHPNPMPFKWVLRCKYSLVMPSFYLSYKNCPTFGMRTDIGSKKVNMQN